MKRNDKQKFEISTNGTLLTDENIEYFVNHGFSLFISLDGSASIHDRQRIYSNGKGSFEAIRMSLKSFSDNYPDFYKNYVHLMMTVIDVSEMPYIAKEWHEDELLNSKTPIRISSVAPNYSLGVEKENVDDCLSKYMSILKYYEKHPQYELLRVFFERFLAEWINRPIINLDINEDAPTCVPNNTKLYIDVEGKIGICEKIPDIYRIGSLSTGLDFQAINNIADKTATIIKSRCGKCPVARLCDICPNVIDLSDDEMNASVTKERKTDTEHREKGDKVKPYLSHYKSIMGWVEGVYYRTHPIEKVDRFNSSIDTTWKARKYINSIPKELRSGDSEVKFLVERFGIDIL